MGATRRKPEKKAAGKGAKAPAKEVKVDDRAATSPNPEEHDPDNVDEQWLQPKEMIKPDDQLDLDEAELEKEFTRILNANNPHAPQNIARYNYKERAYKCSPNVEQLFMHFEMDGGLLFKGAEEGAKKSVAAEGGEGGGAGGAGDAAKQGEGGAKAEGGAPAGGAAGEEGVSAQPVEWQPPPKKETLRNQFNFSERASQTFNNPHRDRETSTEPPPRATFSATATQWEIYDAYVLDQERQKLAKEKAAKQGKKDETSTSRVGAAKRLQALDAAGNVADDLVHSASMLKSAKIVERMVNQNTYDDIAQDFKYWEDASDEFRDNEGTLLPLWKFTFDKARKKSVTSVCFNPRYRDLFAVSYGSYDFLRQGSGLVCSFSLKNPSFPEFIFPTESGVMCLDFHTQHPSLLAAGLYDGSVAVFDMQSPGNKPIFQSTTKSGKHTDPVWQVYWQEDDLDKNLNFCSVSSDGRVTGWTLVKNELHHTEVIELKLAENMASAGGLEKERDGPAGVEQPLFGLACGTTFDFNKKSDHLFIVGTEEGRIYKCSKAYNSQYLSTYDAHHMAVYTVQWNKFHSDIFISCSADWTIKVWHHNHPTPIFTFDLKVPVGDVVWSPYASTVFACVTADGKVRVYDLHLNKHEPICEQAVVRKSKLTHLSFNPSYPIIIVGDDRGGVTSLKLSPNLRKSLNEKIQKNLEDANYRESEILKFNNLISSLEIANTPEFADAPAAAAPAAAAGAGAEDANAGAA